MANGWLITLGLINAYIILLVWLVRSGRMEKYNLSLLLGFILMVRTQRGRKLLQTISKPTRVWNVFGDIGVIATLVGMVGMTALFIAILPTVLSPNNPAPAIGANEILVIPGINPFVPLWYGIIALIITLVVHEGGHGVLALANKMRLKSLGLLFAIFPIGAFVEPDEQDLTESPRRSRLRVYAAGPAVNFLVAGIVLLALALTAAAATPTAGAHVWQISADAPSDLSGMSPGDVLVAADGQPLADWSEFSIFMNSTSPGESVNFTTNDGSVHNATLVSRWDFWDGALVESWPGYEEVEIQTAVLQELPPGMALCDGYNPLFEQKFGRAHTGGADCAELLDQMSFLGITQFPAAGAQAILADPFSSAATFTQLAMLPILEVRGSPVLSVMPEFFDTPGSEDVYWIIINTLFWVFWMNLMVGLTNILPMLPLDGGHLFRDAMGGIMEKVRPNTPPEKRDRMVGRIAGAMSIIILVAFLLQIVGPRIVQAIL